MRVTFRIILTATGVLVSGQSFAHSQAPNLADNLAQFESEESAAMQADKRRKEELEDREQARRERVATARARAIAHKSIRLEKREDADDAYLLEQRKLDLQYRSADVNEHVKRKQAMADRANEGADLDFDKERAETETLRAHNDVIESTAVKRQDTYNDERAHAQNQLALEKAQVDNVQAQARAHANHAEDFAQGDITAQKAQNNITQSVADGRNNVSVATPDGAISVQQRTQKHCTLGMFCD